MRQFTSKFKLIGSDGFTLLEVIIVIGLIGLMAVMIIPDIQYGNNWLTLKNAGHNLVLTTRQAQNLTITGAVGPNGKVPEQGYSLKIFSKDDMFYPNSFAIFAEYNTGPVLVGNYETLPDKINVSSPIANSFWQIKFLPLNQGIILVNSIISSEMSVTLTNLDANQVNFVVNAYSGLIELRQ